MYIERYACTCSCDMYKGVLAICTTCTCTCTCDMYNVYILYVHVQEMCTCTWNMYNVYMYIQYVHVWILSHLILPSHTYPASLSLPSKWVASSGVIFTNFSIIGLASLRNCLPMAALSGTASTQSTTC